MPTASDGGPGTHSVRAELSREMVRLYKEQFGRGPTKARTEFAGPDTLLCTLEDSMTPAEHSLAEKGEHQRLRDTRLYFQYATEDEFRGVVERVLGRKVRAFVSGMDTEHDVSSEVFYLETGNGPSPS
ncbi:MAG: Na-translocating system protein MpsC family protein [Solirubrobacterales bacterium]